ncbi:MAG: type II toxin-antitoxin system RelE/ParE family toxin [Candidatus Wildermuthbacteria bacterium]|nr:type II toxin-antitoxin system RelE/ParE family toxin [Candidatus Wildermuthbacteria bacterium]
MYRIRTTLTFDAYIKKLDRPIAKRIIDKVEQLADSPKLLRHTLKYLPQDLANLQKYRVGDWRVLFWVDHSRKEITLYGVEHRSRVYKRFRK